MSSMTPGLRKALIAGGITVALTGGGAAAVWAGTQPSPTPSSATASPDPTATASPSPSPGSKSFAVHGRGIHGEFTVKNQDGTYRIVLTQTGKIESVNSTSITVKSDDGFTQSYAINSDTRISRMPTELSELRNGKGKPTLPSATAADLKAGDTVRIAGSKDGDTVTAQRIVSGELPAVLKGHGLKGRGHS
ncbi:DUF5666 domain-containing protein [Arthrobacter sp. StoSoilB5]|uniref:DUF5666 domain-containing protein n=1 Tax=Arthrobacter sp. StoSoilB5 TaxID=2830992 RepID=UPI001CC33BE8|nr:DUF5666 domain-containing protein [Arthrobacter sp. StoSoilB5]BCW44242.1 hypothetical protein StoSoilB5_14260 [Arthrobacter sp. StoSoilB5]